jgi:hypothetical protein
MKPMRGTIRMLMGVVAASALLPMAAQACGVCHKPKCAGVPACVVQPAYRCVTEMVPYTVIKTRTKVELIPETFTVMTRVCETNFVEQTCMVTRPVIESHPVQQVVNVRRTVYDTQQVPQQVTTCRLVPETTYVDRAYSVCRPVTTTREVPGVAYQATTQVVAVPTVSHSNGGCGLGLLCGKKRGLSTCGGCQYQTQTCYTPVPTTRTVSETHYVRETQMQQVPVTTCRWVTDTQTIMRTVTTCRVVCEQKVVTNYVKSCRYETVPVTRKVPVVSWKCVPKTMTRYRTLCVPEQVPVTCYRPVTRIEMCAPVMAAPVISPAPVIMPVPSGQVAPSTQASKGKDKDQNEKTAKLTNDTKPRTGPNSRA